MASHRTTVAKATSFSDPESDKRSIQHRLKLLDHEGTKINLEICKEKEVQAEMLQQISTLKAKLERSKQFVVYKSNKLDEIANAMQEVLSFHYHMMTFHLL